MSDLSARLDGVRGSRAKCPRCKRHGALSFREVTGKARLKCFAGCTEREIVAALHLSVGDLRPPRPVFERRDLAEAALREREAYNRDPQAYLRGSVRRAIGIEQDERRRDLGHYAPLRSVEIDKARKRVAQNAGLRLSDVPPAIGWPLWPESSHTMPALWECAPHDEDPNWPGLFMAALAVELGGIPISTVAQADDPWITYGDLLHRAAIRARVQLRQGDGR